MFTFHASRFTSPSLTQRAYARLMTGNVGDFKTVLSFAWKYMRPYWTRLTAGIVLGCLCGLTASTFIWATRTLAERLQVEPAKTERDKPRPPLFPGLDARLKQWKQATSEVIDPWLP